MCTWPVTGLKVDMFASWLQMTVCHSQRTLEGVPSLREGFKKKKKRGIFPEGSAPPPLGKKKKNEK